MCIEVLAQERIPVVRAERMSVGELPEAVDNSLSDHFPPLINQIGGSCAQASYIGYMYTYEMSRILDRKPAESGDYRFSYLYTWNFINGGEDVGSFGYDGLSIAMSNGVMTEADYPKTTSTYTYYWASGYDKYYRAMCNRIKCFKLIDVDTPEGIEQVKRYLYDHGQEGSKGGVVTFSSKATNWKFNDYYSGPSRTGYKSLLTELATEGGHAMTIVGYDDLVEFNAPDGTLSKGAFIVVNTWGGWSHDNGRFYLPYWFFLNRNSNDGSMLSRDVCTVEPEYRKPKICFRVTIDCDARNNLSFNLGVSEMKGKYPKVEYKMGIADYQGGPYNMCGRYASSTIEFGFDFSSALKFVDETNELSYYFIVNRNSKDGKKASFATLKKLSVLDYREDENHPREYTLDVPASGLEIKAGNNVFRIDTVRPKEVSRSPIEWISSRTGKPLTSPIVLRTAKGKYAKMRVLEYDKEAGTMRIKYVYSVSGDTDLQ